MIEQKERDFCICYQEKTKLKWFIEYISTVEQKVVFLFVLINALYQILIIGFEIIYKDEKKFNQKNLTIPLIVSFIIYIILPIIIFFIYFLIKKNDVSKKHSNNKTKYFLSLLFNV